MTCSRWLQLFQLYKLCCTNILMGITYSFSILFRREYQLVRDAVDLMRKRGYSQLPVFDGNRCVGSISEKTILDRAARGEPLESLLNNRVRDIMDSPLPMVNDDTPLEMVLGLLQGNYGVLVTKGESTIGILTKSDILKVKQ